MNSRIRVQAFGSVGSVEHGWNCKSIGYTSALGPGEWMGGNVVRSTRSEIGQALVFVHDVTGGGMKTFKTSLRAARSARIRI